MARLSFIFVIYSVLVYFSAFVNCASTNKNDFEQLNCELVKPFFDNKNITLISQDNTNGALCGGKCCSGSVEKALRRQVQRDFQLLLRHNSRTLQGLLDTTRSTLHDHIIKLTRQAENKTSTLFSQVYRSMSSLSNEPIKVLYSDIRKYINQNESTMFSSAPLDIKSSVIKFFTDIFPLVHHRNNHSKDFNTPYKNCLRERIGDIQPFGDIPRQLARSLSKSLEATRILLQAFSIGVEVLNTTEELLTEEGNNKECHDALFKMTYCPKCLGLQKQAKPCSGYCLNVLRGCLTGHVTELDISWNGYVEAMERLVIAAKQHNNEAGVNADSVIRALETMISESIMYSMENEKELDLRVLKACGMPQFVDGQDITSNDLTIDVTHGRASKPTRPSINLRDTPLPEAQLLSFLTSIAKSRGFYLNLPDNLCKDESFAESNDQNCWNGQRIGEYTKTVVDAGLAMQKYNPEMKFNADVQNTDSRVSNLAEKLRHVHSLVISSLGSVTIPESDNFMQGDAADGSGSGYSQWDNDNYDDDDDVDRNGSGSGDGPGKNDHSDGKYPEIMTVPDSNLTPIDDNTIGGSNSLTTSATLLITSLTFLRIYCWLG